MATVIGKGKRKVRRILNQRHSYDFPEVAQGWEKIGLEPVITGENGSVFDPFVRWVEGRYCMYLSDRASGSLVLYKSKDGAEWSRSATVLAGNGDNSWEKKVNRASFIIRNGVWMLWYTGQNSEGSSIGLALSENGHDFQRYSINPVMKPELPIEAKSVMNPCVIYNDRMGKYQMWYAAGDSYEPDIIMYAESEDGIKWNKYPQPVVKANKLIVYQQYKVGACDVVLMPDGVYLMAYIGYQNLDVARICFATSTDGIQWTLSSANPVISPGKGKWDSDSIYKPTMQMDADGNIKLWYNGRRSTTESIGLAEGRHVI